MREAEAKKLRPGDRVRFQDDMPNDDNGSLGTVTDRDYARFVVKWDDGVECSYSHILAMAIQPANPIVETGPLTVWRTGRTYNK